jgi:hypothetical protein
VYDQVSCPGFAGCSGSGLFLNNEKMAGLLVRGSGETYILCVPARRIVKWAKSTNIEWIVDDKVPVPSQDEIDKIIVEDNGISYDAKSADKKPASPHANVKKLIYKKNTCDSVLCLPLLP